MQQLSACSPGDLLKGLDPCLETGHVYRTEGRQWMAFPLKDEPGYLAFLGSLTAAPVGELTALDLTFLAIDDVFEGNEDLPTISKFLKSRGYEELNGTIRLAQVLALAYIRPDQLSAKAVEFLNRLIDRLKYSKLSLKSESTTVPWN